ncbi:MAG: 3-hydroxyisobutyrate dehydrogenase [Sphingomonadales bacterium]|jgi:3-hydroxyisobutyrate dehydrogenase
MSKIAFIGLGNMGGPMAINLVKAGHDVRAFDLSADAKAQVAAAGGHAVNNLKDAVSGADAVVTMLPAGRHVTAVYGGEDGVMTYAAPGTLFIDSSTIDVETSREVAAMAHERGFEMVDAPVSGGVAAAAGGTLTFMVGGTDDGFKRAQAILEHMGKNIVHAGSAGAGQAAKICNNMMLGIQMISVCEGFALAEKLGLAADKLFEISSKASGQCWSLTSYCPEPGPVEAAPSNRDYQPGFAAAMMLKDLKLAQDAAQGNDASTPLGAYAAELYEKFCEDGNAGKDFSGIIESLKSGKL